MRGFFSVRAGPWWLCSSSLITYWFLLLIVIIALQWRNSERDSVSNHQPYDCLLNCLFRHRSKKTAKLRVTGLCAGNSSVTGEFPTQGPVTRKMFPFDDVIMELFVMNIKQRTCIVYMLKYSKMGLERLFPSEAACTAYVHQGALDSSLYIIKQRLCPSGIYQYKSAWYCGHALIVPGEACTLDPYVLGHHRTFSNGWCSGIYCAITPDITSLTTVYSTVYSDADERKHQSSTSLTLCGEFTGDRWIHRTNGQ